ncbi:MAG TPA: Cof-type HAD-IIB family hydrolase [Clostridiales bacterium]|nr:Cof-type HAD-IIB family hydrolase [Clostridiales bacterium]
MAYKLLAVDIDGTLLDSKGNLTHETIKAINLGIEKGMIFTISTGRPIQGLKSLIEKLELTHDLPFITYNGAMVIMWKSKDILFECSLNNEDAMNIIELGKKLGTTVMVWTDNKLYASELSDKAYKYSSISTVTPLLLGNDRDSIEKTIAKGVTKILWYDEVETINRYLNEVSGYLSENVNFHTSQPYFLEFVDKRASKAKAMEKLGEHFNINIREMIAVGDGLNDLSMIEYAGLGVAMENANDAVKEKADYITLSNDEDGVAHVIYKYIL